MNIIQKQAQEFVEFNLNNGDLYRNFISKVKDRLYDYNKLIYKIEFIEYVIRVCKIEYDNHLPNCTDLKNCSINSYYENVIFFLQEELEEFETQITPNDFNFSERNNINQSLVLILKELNEIKIGQQITYDDLSEEFEELKDLYYLNKKHWTEIFVGKMTEMVAGGIISETLSKSILKIITSNYKNLI